MARKTKAQAAPELKESALEGIAGRLAAVSAATGLNLRTGPARSFDVAEVLSPDAVVVILALPCEAEVPGWALIDTGVWAGWVQRKYLKEQEET